MEIKEISAISAGKVMATWYALLGLLFGGVMGLMTFVGLSPLGNDGMMAGAAAAAFLIIGTPIMYGVVGFIAGILMALFYNISASLVGGIVLRIEHGGTNLADAYSE